MCSQIGKMLRVLSRVPPRCALSREYGSQILKPAGGAPTASDCRVVALDLALAAFEDKKRRIRERSSNGGEDQELFFCGARLGIR